MRDARDPLDRLVTDLEARRLRLLARRAELPPPPDPSAAERLERDLAGELAHLNRLLEGLRRPVPVALSPPTPTKAPLPYRAAGVLYRRTLDAYRRVHWNGVRALGSLRRPPADDAPLFTVVLPTRDRKERLLAGLRAYDRQLSSPRFEMIVVDDGSVDGSADAAEALEPERYELRILRQEGRGPAAARNLALKHARGAFVLFTGDDIEPAPDLLLRHWQTHRRIADPRTAVLGHIRPPDGPLTATMRHVDGPGAQQFNYGWMRSGKTYDFRHFYTSNLSLHRTFLNEVDGFSTVFPAAAFEDAELAYRLSHRGLRIVYEGSIRAIHHHPYDAEGFYDRQVRCGRMARVMERLHPELARFTGRREIELRRAALVVAGATRSDSTGGDSTGGNSTGSQFEPLKNTALTVAEALDAGDPPGTDAFLAALFHLAFFEGTLSPVEDADADLLCLSLGADSLPGPAANLLPHLSGPAREAAEELASLPPSAGPVDPDFMHPV